MKFSQELTCKCVLKCRKKLTKLSDGSSSGELPFGNISQGDFFADSSSGSTLLFHAHSGKQLGKLAWRSCAVTKIKKYMAIDLNGVTYETATFELGLHKPWKAEFYCEGTLIGTIVELPWPELGWFRRHFRIRNFERTFEILWDNGDKFAQFSYRGSVSSRTVIGLEVVGSNTTIGVAIADSLCQRKSSYAIIGSEIDSMEDKLSKELCFVASMWIRYQMFQLGFGFG